jgi:hypothetical protein
METPNTPAPAAPASTPSSTPSAPSRTPSPSSSQQVAKHVDPITAPAAKLPGKPPDSKFVDGGEAPQTETPAEKARRLHKIKVDGVEEEVDLDSYDDQALVKELQMAKAARKRMQEKAEYERNFKSFMDAVKKDPLSALNDPAIGVDVRKMVEDQLIEEYKNSQLPPEKQMENKLKAEMEKYKRELEEIKTAKQREQDAIVEQQVFEAALDATDLPKNQTTLYLMAEIAQMNLANGIELSPQQMAHEVRAQVGELTNQVLKGMKGDQLIKYLGQDTVKEILRHSINEARKNMNGAGQPAAPTRTFKAPPSGTQDITTGEKERKPKSVAEFKKFLRDR